MLGADGGRVEATKSPPKALEFTPALSQGLRGAVIPAL